MNSCEILSTFMLSLLLFFINAHEAVSKSADSRIITELLLFPKHDQRVPDQCSDYPNYDFYYHP